MVFGLGKKPEKAVSEVPYRMVESRIRVRGTVVTTSDPYVGESRAVEDVHVEVVHRGTYDGPGRRVRTNVGTQDISVQVTPDERLQSLEYKWTGAGPAVVAATAKLVGFIVSTGVTLLSAASGGVLAGQQDGSPPDPLEDWAVAHPDAAALLAQNTSLAKQAAEKLVELRCQLLTAGSTAQSRDLVARSRAVEAAVEAARAEVARLTALRTAWLAAQRTSHSSELECVVALDQLPLRAPDSPLSAVPTPPTAGSPGHQLWTDFGVLLEVVDPKRVDDAKAQHTPAMGGAEQESRMVRWRAPRPVELWVWRRTPSGSVVLVTRTPIQIADKRCDTRAMELHASSFGEHGGAWTFNDDGSPASIKVNDKSKAAALANALSAAPDALVGGVKQAKELTDTFAAIQDAPAERRKAAAERDLAAAKARVELLGVNATADDVAALARAEHAVKLRTASRAVSPAADALDDLKLELEQLTTQNGIATQRQSAMLAGELADIRAEVARLEQEVLIAKAKWDIEHPGDPED
ncbi:hypothetical protein [Actinokineospora sp. HUAS TT18]|uniref:hypothetical protein n=1 Tax=Actinokineospora sp. HUAS TT18 TaxID=3447451 RepID=UPI003F51FCF2